MPGGAAERVCPRGLPGDRDDEIASVVARHLVKANLSGHDSHGVQRVWQYVAFAEEGHMIPAARPRLLHETTVAALIDAGRGFGRYSTLWAMDWAIDRARASACCPQ